jgi:hypothetical protein
LLVKHKILGEAASPARDKKATKGKKAWKAKTVVKREDQIKADLAAKKTGEDYEKLFSPVLERKDQFNDDIYGGFLLPSVKTLDFRLIATLIRLHKLLASAEPDSRANLLILSTEYAIEQLESGKIALFSILDPTVQAGFSTSLVADLQRVLTEVKERYKYSPVKVFQHFPHLTNVGLFYPVVSLPKIRLYPTQVRLIQTVNQFDRFLLFYNSNFGAGKTTTAIGVVASQRRRSKLVLYCCSTKAVRYTLAQYAVHSGIKLVIAYTDQNGVGFSPHRSLRKLPSSRRELIIADYSTTAEILRSFDHDEPRSPSTLLSRVSLNDLTLIVDEPTDGADIPGSRKVQEFAELFAVAPPKTILISATLPSAEQMGPYVANFRSKWGDVHMETISINEIKVGCHLINRQGEVFVAHHRCRTAEDLERLLSKLRDSQFLGRLYTAPVVSQLYEAMARAKIPNLPSLTDYFARPSRFSNDSVARMAGELLGLLSRHPEKIATVCQPVSVDSRRYDLFGDQASSIDLTFEYDRLGTTDAFKMLGPTLVVARDPFECLSWFAGLVGGEEVVQLLRNYERGVKEEDKKAREALKVATKRKSETGETRLEREREVALLVESANLADVDFPASKQINTIQHLKKYAKQFIDVKSVHPNKVREPLDLTEAPLTTSSRHLLLPLFAGVGVLADDSPSTDNHYERAILDYLIKGKLAFVCCDDSIIFGVNSPSDNLIVTDGAMRNREIGTIFQLLARIGRPGKSWVAYAYIDRDVEKKMASYVLSSEPDFHREALNMNQALGQVLIRMNQELQVKERRLSQDEQKEERLDLHQKFLERLEDDKQPELRKLKGLIRQERERRLRREQERRLMGAKQEEERQLVERDQERERQLFEKDQEHKRRLLEETERDRRLKREREQRLVGAEQEKERQLVSRDQERERRRIAKMASSPKQSSRLSLAREIYRLVVPEDNWYA